MNLISWIAIGIAVGWIVSLIQRRETDSALLLRILVGSGGAVLCARWVGQPAGSVPGPLDPFNAAALLAALAGALLFLGLLQLLPLTWTRGPNHARFGWPPSAAPPAAPPPDTPEASDSPCATPGRDRAG
jgi:uncharacterized membrane protein YeaQ/YmgE (transglycosylase-associated protein family)